jgi:hypothetical protein
MAAGDIQSTLRRSRTNLILGSPASGQSGCRSPLERRRQRQQLPSRGSCSAVSTIPKSVTPVRVRENLAAADLVVTEADMDGIAGLDRGYRLIAGEFRAL